MLTGRRREKRKNPGRIAVMDNGEGVEKGKSKDEREREKETREVPS